MTGVILENTDTDTVAGFFNYIKLKYGLNPLKPFHSYHIFEDDSPKNTVKIQDTKTAKQLMAHLGDFISVIPIKICIVSVDKSEFRVALGVTSIKDFSGTAERKRMREFPYEVMSAKLFTWFAQHLDDDAVGGIFVDARRGGEKELIIALNSFRDPKGPLDNATSKLIDEKCTALCFAEKNFLSGGIEIADFISWTAFFHARRTMNTMDHLKLSTTWKKIKSKLDGQSIMKIGKSEVRKFYKISRNGVHKYLKKP